MQAQNVSSLFDQISPHTQKYLKRAVGVGLGCYLGKTILTSGEFKNLMNALKTWRKRQAEQLIESPGCGGDTGDTFRYEDKIPAILVLSPDLRQKCWEYVSYRDLKNLRLSCKRFQYDIDYVVGLSVGIDSRHEESFDWIKHISIQSCTIYHLPSYYDWTFFPKPKALKSLKFTEATTISPNILNIILSTFTSLEKLQIYFEHDLFLDDMDYISLFDTFKALESKLSKLSVRYIEEFRAFQWTLDISVKEFPSFKSHYYSQDAILLPSHLTCIKMDLEHYNAAISSSYTKLRFFCRKMMDFQRNLKQLECNLGPVSWDVYAQVLRDNKQTLEKVELDNISCWDSWSTKDERETSFDWNLIQNCQKLKVVSLSGENCTRLGPLTYIPLRSSTTLNLETINLNLGVVFWKIYSSIVIRSSATLKNITLLKLTTFSPSTGDETPFDFSIFEKCENLSSLIVGGQQLTYMDIGGFRTIPRCINNLQLFWINLRKEDVIFIRSELNQLESNSKFLEYCQVAGLNEEEDAKDLWDGVEVKSSGYWQAFAYAWNAFPLPILETVGLLWLMWVH